MARRFEPRKNREIRSENVRLIDEDGQQLGIKPTQEAVGLAQERGLDLIEIASQSSPPVCRIIDYSKYKYEHEKKIKEARKKNKTTHIKEIRIRPKISPHDLDIKMSYIRDFLDKKDKVRVSIIYQGREIQHQERGREILKKLIENMQDIAEPEKDSRMEGNRLFVTLLPKTKIKVKA